MNSDLDIYRRCRDYNPLTVLNIAQKVLGENFSPVNANFPSIWNSNLYPSMISFCNGNGKGVQITVSEGMIYVKSPEYLSHAENLAKELDNRGMPHKITKNYREQSNLERISNVAVSSS